MPEFVFDIPSQRLALIFATLAISSVALGLFLVKPLFRLVFGTGPEFNSNLSFGASGFNLFYGLLLGLLTVTAYQNSENVREAIQAEASSIGSLYNIVESHPEPIRSDVQSMLRDYVLYTIHRDWARHREGNFLDGGSNRLGAIGLVLASYKPEGRGDAIVHQSAMDAYQALGQSRQQRLAGVITQIPTVLWYAVLVGAVTNVVLLCLLKMRPHTQFMVGSFTSFFLAVVLFVIVALDRPLRGAEGLPPAPFGLLWERQLKWDDARS